MDKGENLLVDHLCSGRFLAGASKDRWLFENFQWPALLIKIKAKDNRWFTLRFNCSGYPEIPPTSTLWDVARQQQLSTKDWPCGGRVTQVFNPSWKGGSALYLPCDRQAIEGHPNWLTEFPDLIWKPDIGILQYIEAIYEVLQSNELQST